MTYEEELQALWARLKLTGGPAAADDLMDLIEILIDNKQS